MNLKSLPNQPLSLLVSAASPGSALAHQLGVATFGSMLLRRTSEPPRVATEGVAEAQRLEASSTGGWLARLFERLENWAWDRQQREREGYLAQSADLYDLEYRMRQLDGDMVSRGCMLLRWAEMKHWFGAMFRWLSTATPRDGPVEPKTIRVSHYELHLRQLDERVGRLFLP